MLLLRVVWSPVDGQAKPLTVEHTASVYQRTQVITPLQCCPLGLPPSTAIVCLCVLLLRNIFPTLFHVAGVYITSRLVYPRTCSRIECDDERTTKLAITRYRTLSWVLPFSTLLAVVQK